MSEPLVSIVIPSYNYDEYIYDCLVSCINQSYKNIEIIVVDDNSTDESVAAVTEIRSVFTTPPIKVIPLTENMGYSFAKNVGIRVAAGTLIAHLDADDMLTKDSIRCRVKRFLKNPDVDLVHGRAYKFEGRAGYFACNNWLERKDWSKLKEDNTFIHAQGVMVKREVYKRFGLYFTGLRAKADKEMWYRLGIQKGQTTKITVERIDNKVAFYRKHETSMLRQRALDPIYDAQIVKAYNNRCLDIDKNGVTENNTEFLK